MKPEQIIEQLEANKLVFESLLANKDETAIRWRPDPSAWSLLDIICHLYDEEREDFRTRVLNTLFTPTIHPPSIDPVGWVTSRQYADQDYAQKVNDFLSERTSSIDQLKSIQHPEWENVYTHPGLGPMSAYRFLANWLAHDYHHIRQINRRLYEFLKFSSNESLSYAGDW
jgi:hypothetical protein